MNNSHIIWKSLAGEAKYISQKYICAHVYRTQFAASSAGIREFFAPKVYGSSYLSTHTASFPARVGSTSTLGAPVRILEGFSGGWVKGNRAGARRGWGCTQICSRYETEEYIAQRIGTLRRGKHSFLLKHNLDEPSENV